MVSDEIDEALRGFLQQHHCRLPLFTSRAAHHGCAVRLHVRNVAFVCDIELVQSCTPLLMMVQASDGLFAAGRIPLISCNLHAYIFIATPTKIERLEPWKTRGKHHLESIPSWKHCSIFLGGARLLQYVFAVKSHVVQPSSTLTTLNTPSHSVVRAGVWNQSRPLPHWRLWSAVVVEIDTPNT